MTRTRAEDIDVTALPQTWLRIGDSHFTIGVYPAINGEYSPAPDHIRILYSEKKNLISLTEQSSLSPKFASKIQAFFEAHSPLECLQELKLLAKLEKLPQKVAQALTLSLQLIEKQSSPDELAFGFGIAQAALLYQRHQEGAFADRGYTEST